MGGVYLLECVTLAWLIFVETQLFSINFIFNVCAASCDLAQLLLLADGFLEAQA